MSIRAFHEPSTRRRIARQAISMAVIVGFAFGSLSPIWAAPPAQSISRSLSESMTAADAVLHGTVSRIDYRVADNRKHGSGLPHTFVTYRVTEVLSGRVDTAAVTLRFIGGPDGQGGFVSVSHVPSFNVGDEDILMVRGNGQSTCPLVDCEKGRYRIFQSGVYNARGVPMTNIESGRTAFTGRPEPKLLRRSMPTPTFDDLIKNPRVAAIVARMTETTSLAELRRRYEREAPAFTEYTMASRPDAEDDYGWDSATLGAGTTPTKNLVRPLLASDLLASIRTAAQDDTISGKPPIQSLDPHARFTAAASTMAPPSTGNLE